jgi:hypothetical protein
MLKVPPNEVVTDAAPVYPAVLDDLVPSAWHHVEQYANNPIESDHSQLKHRLRPMRGLRTDVERVEPGSPRERSDRFEEACQVLIGLLSQETTDFSGSYYQLTGARCEPKGPQPPHPPICSGESARCVPWPGTRNTGTSLAVPARSSTRYPGWPRRGSTWRSCTSPRRWTRRYWCRWPKPWTSRADRPRAHRVSRQDLGRNLPGSRPRSTPGSNCHHPSTLVSV